MLFGIQITKNVCSDKTHMWLLQYFIFYLFFLLYHYILILAIIVEAARKTTLDI
jgi:hypothetical protein